MEGSGQRGAVPLPRCLQVLPAAVGRTELRCLQVLTAAVGKTGLFVCLFYIICMCECIYTVMHVEIRVLEIKKETTVPTEVSRQEKL